MRNYYNLIEVSAAKETLKLANQTDKFGKPMVDPIHIDWANKVLTWFNNYLCSIRNIIKNTGRKWNAAVSLIWARLKQGLTRISDEVIKTIYKPLKKSTYVQLPLR